MHTTVLAEDKLRQLPEPPGHAPPRAGTQQIIKAVIMLLGAYAKEFSLTALWEFSGCLARTIPFEGTCLRHTASITLEDMLLLLLSHFSRVLLSATP